MNRIVEIMNGENMNTSAADSEEWKHFDDSPASRLLTAIYGRPSPVIHYPPNLNKKKNGKALGSKKEAIVQHPKRFYTGGKNVFCEDPNAYYSSKPKVQVPRNIRKGASYNPPALIDIVPRRRHSEQIKVEADRIQFLREHYRLPISHPTSTKEEKERLGDIFTYKGGQALPKELCHPEGLTPLEQKQKAKAAKEKAERDRKIRKRLGLKSKEEEEREAASKQEEGTMFDQIVEEIKERMDYLDSMLNLTNKQKYVAQVRSEINSRFRELEKIDPNRAREMMNSIKE